MSNSYGARIALRIMAMALIAITLMWSFGHIAFAPWATDLLTQVTSAVGIHGTENIENFYMVVTTIISVVVAITLVMVVSRVFTQRRADYCE